MDEPFAALDEITRTKLNDDLVALKCELGATVVFVTHSVYESVYLSDRIVVMAPRPGRVVAEIVVPSAAAAQRGFPPRAPNTPNIAAQTSQALHRAMDAEAGGEGLRGADGHESRAAARIRRCRPLALVAALVALGGGRRSQRDSARTSCPRRA